MAIANKKTHHRIARLKDLIESHGGTAQFVRNLSASGATVPNDSYFNQLLRGHKTSFGEKSASNIAMLAGLPENYFDLTEQEEDDQTLRESLAQSAMVFGDKLFEPDPGYIAFDLLDVNAAAGNGYQQADFPEVVNKIHVLESWAHANINVELDRIKVITARGTSMQGTIENGDVLFVDATINAYDGDGVYVIARGNDIQVKRLQKLNGDVLAIISDNRAYESERLSGSDADSIVICGRVLAAWTIRKFW